MNILGPIRFESADGQQTATASYRRHPSLRPFQIAFQGTWHVQNRCEAGVWVYRALPGAAGSIGTDPLVTVDG